MERETRKEEEKYIKKLKNKQTKPPILTAQHNK